MSLTWKKMISKQSQKWRNIFVMCMEFTSHIFGARSLQISFEKVLWLPWPPSKNIRATQTLFKKLMLLSEQKSKIHCLRIFLLRENACFCNTDIFQFNFTLTHGDGWNRIDSAADMGNSSIDTTPLLYWHFGTIAIYAYTWYCCFKIKRRFPKILLDSCFIAKRKGPISGIL